MKGAMPVPGPMRIKGVDMLDGRRNSWLGFGKILTMGSFGGAATVDAWLVLLRKGEQMHSNRCVANPAILRPLLSSCDIEGVR